MAKRFSQEFKQQAIEYVLTHTYQSLSEIANHLGIDASTLDKWVRQSSQNHSSRRPLTPEQQRLLELEKENKELKQINEILKKLRYIGDM